MLANLTQYHDDGEIDCGSCEEQFGPCSCTGIVHAEYQEVFRKTAGYLISEALLVLECDRCGDEYEIG